MKFAGLYAYIAGQNVIENDILYEVVSVVLFVVILLYARKRDREDRSVLARNFVGSLNENGIVGLYMNAEGFIGIAVADKNIVRIAKLDREEVAAAAYSRKLAARNYSCVLVDYADNAAYRVAHLMNNTLK